jgi:hypothetical protein
MLFKDSVFIGIDPPSGIKSLTYAVLDKDLNLVAMGKDELAGVVAFVGGQKAAYVGVNAPRRLNKGLMKKDSVRDRLTPKPKPGRYVSYRVAEYELIQHNIRIPKTPDKLDLCPGWMKNGFLLYKRLEELGFKDYPADDHQLQMFEVYPHAAYTTLLKRIPYLKKTLEGRLQRQLLLHSLNLFVPDPMRIFEEITRFKIIQGKMPLEWLYSVEELEALMAAYMAWKAAREPEELCPVGDPKEGEIILPVKDLKPKYN